MLPGIFLILQDPDQYLYHVQQASLLLCCSLLCMTFVAIIDDSSTLAITLAIASAGFSLWVIVPVVAMARIAFSNPGTPIDTVHSVCGHVFWGHFTVGKMRLAARYLIFTFCYVFAVEPHLYFWHLASRQIIGSQRL
ncbi:MAG: hypothetical protein J0H83_18180 [Candidatus Melainabacteria bacterium]|nr:hypothetical protein [Candidatus Melainabacteria bacterium]